MTFVSFQNGLSNNNNNQWCILQCIVCERVVPTTSTELKSIKMTRIINLQSTEIDFNSFVNALGTIYRI